MSNITSIDIKRPHFLAKTLCLNPECFNQYISVYPEEADPKELECPKCGTCKSFAVLIPPGMQPHDYLRRE